MHYLRRHQVKDHSAILVGACRAPTLRCYTGPGLHGPAATVREGNGYNSPGDGAMPLKPRWITAAMRTPGFIAIASLLIAGFAFVTTAPPAAAEQCLQDGCHYYSVAQLNGAFSGMEGQWHNNNMYLSSSDFHNLGHLSDEMWFNTAFDNSTWVETGLNNALYEAAPKPDPCNCIAYQQFWADNAAGVFYYHFLDNTSPNGSNHVYEILNRSGTNYFDVYLDYSLVGTSTNQTIATSADIQTGLELDQGTADETLDTSSHADNFDNYIQYRSGGSLHDAGFNSFIIDQGCNPHPQGYCMNGKSYGSGEYSDSKP